VSDATLLVLTAGATAIGIAMVVLAVFTFQTAAVGPAQETAHADMQESISDRVWRPFLRSARGLWTSLTPMFAQNYIDRQLDAAGNPAHLARNGFIFLQLGIGAALWLVAITIGAFAGNLLLGLLLLVLATPVALVITYAGLAARVQARQSEILRSLPDMLDLIAVGTEAGQPLNAVLLRVRTAFQDALGEELGRSIREVELGVPRAEALEDMGNRTGLPEVHAFAQAMIQSQQLGVGLASLLRLQAEDQRRERQQRLAEDAARTGLLILFPTAGCIFPALYIVILGPAALFLLHWAGH
jgi:tight adherence protein C